MKISCDLEMRRSNAFNGAKMLKVHGNAKRLRERGSKRIRFIAGDYPGLQLHPQAGMLGRMALYISSRRQDVAEGDAADRLDRLDRLAEFHRLMNAAMQQLIEHDGRNTVD
jgi:hypothetical protein